MNSLHRELAPISSAAWAEIEEEARRTFTTRAAARRVIDVGDPAGFELSAIGTGHTTEVDSPADGVYARQRTVQPVLELRAPFYVTRRDVDNVDRGARDSDWEPVKEAAKRLATAEDRAVFHGAPAAGIAGIGPMSSNASLALPDEVRDYPVAVAQAISALRLAGVGGSYSLLLSAGLYTAVAETTDHGYPVRDHLGRMMLEGSIIWAPALDGALVVSERGGDYELQLGRDLSIGYVGHDDEQIELYLEETFAFRVNTAEASVVLTD